MSRIKSLQYYLLARLMLVPLMLWTIFTVIFVLMRATPGDPVDAIVGSRASADIKNEMRAKLGLDKSLWEQYSNYLGKLLHFDLGESITVLGSKSPKLLAIISQQQSS
jgi:peptide/nickel transport system permease protein